MPRLARRVSSSFARLGRATLAWTMIGGAAFVATSAHADDLKVGRFIITQALDDLDVELRAGATTMIRIEPRVVDGTGNMANVDGYLRVSVDGVELPGSPYWSVNGPIVARLSPNIASLDDTLNFLVNIPEGSSDVDLEIVLDPQQRTTDTDPTNNRRPRSNIDFACGETVWLAYVPVEYQSTGEPLVERVRPGIGDNFVRAIFPVGEWNYYRAPVPALDWNQDINNSSVQLLNRLRDIRLTDIPATGGTRPEFVYGWLPGNPYSGNGRAIGIPGDAAFGNTQLSRSQRTFAHEMGHLFDLSHNSESINQLGVDVEHHLLETQNLDQIFPTTRFDIMVPGQLTNTAFVVLSSKMTVLDDPRARCDADALNDGGSSGGATSDTAVESPVKLRVSGVIDHARGIVRLDPVDELESVTADPGVADGGLRVELLDARRGVVAWARVPAEASRACCAQAPGEEHFHPDSPLHVVIDPAGDPARIASVRVVDVATGRELGSIARSRSAPEISIDSIAAIDAEARGIDAGDPEGADALTGAIRVDWSATDADGDDVRATMQYSPDGGARWVPLFVGREPGTFEFDASEVPTTNGRNAIFRLRASDGLNVVERVFETERALGEGTPPAVDLLTPNDGDAYPFGAGLILHAAAFDLEDELLPDASIAWSSSRDGDLGFGRELPFGGLSVGTHVLTVTGTDSGGLTDSASVTVTIGARTLLSSDLDGNGVVDGADLAVLLANWASDIPLADLDADGTVSGSDLAILLANWS